MGSSPATGGARRVLRVALLAALLGVAALAAVLALLGSDRGRAEVATRVSALLTELLRGGFHIGELREITPWRVVVRNVDISDPWGKPVAHADLLSADVDLRGLLSGKLLLDNVQGQGAWASLHQEHGELAIASTFFPATPSAPTAESGPGFVVILRRGHLAGGRVTNLPGQPSVERVSGSFSLSYKQAFRMTAEHVQASVGMGHAPAQLSVRRFQLNVAKGEGSRVEATLSTGRAGDDQKPERLRVEASASWGQQGFQDIRAGLQGVLGPAWLTALGQAALAEGLLAPVELQAAAQLEQPAARLAVQGQLGGPGGNVTIAGDCTLVRCEVSARSDRLVLASIVRGAPPEPLAFDFDLGLSGNRFSDFSLRVRAASFGTLAAPAFSTHGAWSTESLTLQGLQGSALAIEPGSFSLEVRSGPEQITGKLGFRLARLVGAADWGPLAGLRAQRLRVQAHGSYRASSTQLNASLTLLAEQLEQRDVRLEELELHATLAGSVQQPRISLLASAARIQAQQHGFANGQLSVIGNPARFTVTGSLAHGAQQGKLALNVVRSPGVLRAAGNAELAGLPGAPPLHVTLGNAVLRGNTLDVEALEATLGAASLALSGRYASARDSQLQLHAKQICMEQLAGLASASAPWLGRLRGCVHGEAYLAGRPDDPSLSARLAVEELTFDGHALGRVEADLQLAETTREASLRLGLTGPVVDFRAQLAGKLPELSRQALLRAPYRAELHASTRLPALAPLLQVDPARLRDLSLALDLSSDSQNLNSELSLSYADKVVVRANARGRQAADGLQTGRPLSELDVDLTLEQLPLKLLALDAALATANLVGSVQLRGLLAERPRGELQLRVLDLKAPGMVVPPLIVKASADPEAVRMTAEARTGAKALLQLSAQVPWRWTDATHVVLQKAGVRAHAELADLPLSLLTMYVPGISDAKGSVAGTLALKGLAEPPDLTGKLRLREGSFTLQDPFLRVEHIQLALEVEKDHVRLRDLELTDQAGRLTAEGDLQLVGLSPTVGHLKVSAHEFPLRREGIYFAKLSAEIDVGAELAKRPMQVQVKVRELAVALPADQASTLQPLEQHRDVSYVDRSAPGTDGIEEEQPPLPLVIVLDASEPFWIRRAGLSVELSAKLRLSRATGGGSITGVIQIRRGLLTLLGRGFELQRGSVTFEGGKTVDPAVVLDAVHKLGDGQTVTASVRGTLSAPTLSFSSSVPGVTTNAQALQLLMSGRDNTAGETAQAQVGSALAALTTGLFSKVTSGKYGKYVPVLSLESGASAGTRMRAGVQADDLIPQVLRSIVQGIYLEGYVGRKNQGGSRTGAGGVLMELYFPRHLVTGGTWELPNNWSVEVTWEP